MARVVLNSTVLFLAIYSVTSSAHAQSKRAVVLLDLSRSDLLQVTVEPREPLQTWSFLNSYAGALGVAERVNSFRGDTREVEPANIKRIGAGVFRSERPLKAVTYEVRLSLDSVSNPAHVSWLTGEGGVLMLADLLPIEVTRDGAIDVRFQLPSGWRIPSFLGPSRSSTYLLDDPMNAVLNVGPSFQTDSKKFNGIKLDVAISGNWGFSASKVTEAAGQILKAYSEVTRFPLPQARVIVAPLPKTGPETWQAQTRGSTLLLLIDRRAGFKNWIGQLKVIFTHELLHLWVPNALTLKGDYDWFFEGFTLYQALLTAVDLKVISFDEYLNTLARVYDSYLSQPDRLSLIEASEQRWTGANPTVYDKGMLLAFLYDLKFRWETRGESKLSDRYAELFRKYASKTVNANEAIMSVLISSPATEALLKSYVEQSRPLELTNTLKEYGIAFETEGVHSYLRIAPNPTKDQLRVLKSLGYRH